MKTRPKNYFDLPLRCLARRQRIRNSVMRSARLIESNESENRPNLQVQNQQLTRRRLAISLARPRLHVPSLFCLVHSALCICQCCQPSRALDSQNRVKNSPNFARLTFEPIYTPILAFQLLIWQHWKPQKSGFLRRKISPKISRYNRGCVSLEDF